MLLFARCSLKLRIHRVKIGLQIILFHLQKALSILINTATFSRFSGAVLLLEENANTEFLFLYQTFGNFGKNISTKLAANILTGAAVAAFNAIQVTLIPNRRPDAFSSDFDSREFESRENIRTAFTEKRSKLFFITGYKLARIIIMIICSNKRFVAVCERII